MRLDELIPYEKNPRKNDEAVDKVALSISSFGFKVPIIIDRNNVIVAGHTRLKAAKKLGLTTVPVIRADDLTDDQVRAFRLADNKVAELADWDWGLLEDELADIDIDMTLFGFDRNEIYKGKFAENKDPQSDGLFGKFLVPPFSVLDARAGYWQDRKKAWREIIKDDAITREGAQIFQGIGALTDISDTSIFDPCLAEVIITWFTPKKDENDRPKLFDVFAGDTSFGVVGGWLGCDFTGIELRKEQADYNNSRFKELGIAATSRTICDDGRNVKDHIQERSQDLLFSCPPYYDLEVYSDLPNDASNQGSYEEFYRIIDDAFTKAADCLKDDRFAVIVCGDIRDGKRGGYRRFCDDIKDTFERNGFVLWNELILLQAVNTASVRATKPMQTNRKVTKIHQNVEVFYRGDIEKVHSNIEVFYKGDTTKIRQNFGDVAVAGDDLEAAAQALPV